MCDEQDYPGVRLNLGSGDCKWDGWINVDLHSDVADVQCDLRALDFDDNSAGAIAAIHVIEHFYEWEANDLLKEWRRVLQPGGKLILELPCMDKILNYLRECMNAGIGPSPTFSWWAFWGNPQYKSPAMCHKWGYTEQMILDKVRLAGFNNVAIEEPHYHFPQRDMRVVGYK